jgi:hypothetical protein
LQRSQNEGSISAPLDYECPLARGEVSSLLLVACPGRSKERVRLGNRAVLLRFCPAHVGRRAPLLRTARMVVLLPPHPTSNSGGNLMTVLVTTLCTNGVSLQHGQDREVDDESIAARDTGLDDGYLRKERRGCWVSCFSPSLEDCPGAPNNRWPLASVALVGRGRACAQSRRGGARSGSGCQWRSWLTALIQNTRKGPSHHF